jgi:formylglycine-generating enzyme required for sulfatase activity
MFIFLFSILRGGLKRLYRSPTLRTEREQPVHEVSIKPFAMGKFEVTFEEYDRFAIDTNRPLPSDHGNMQRKAERKTTSGLGHPTRKR